MSKRKKKVKWGETPLDRLTKKQLLTEANRMASALMAANGVLCQFVGDTHHPFWGSEGRGGRAIEKCAQAMVLFEGYDAENVYRSYFRYCDDVLFDNAKVKLGFGWHVCDLCGNMVAGDHVEVDNPCRDHKCGGKLRKIEAIDIEPRTSKKK